MVEVRTPIPVTEAIRRVMTYAKKGAKMFVPIEASLGRFLAEDLLADHDVPAFDRSPYDGFAVRAKDTVEVKTGLSVELEVIGEIGAGVVFQNRVQANQAVRIMTGARCYS